MESGLTELRAAVLDWYAGVARDLPWRRTRDPYAILVSEVMLQQTQVSRVVDRYEHWVARWPTAAALGAATRTDVLAQWSGLGYNSRALRLREACAVVAEHGWPTTAAGLQQLPGVGPYTAAAVASFAFGEPVPAVDTNVRRVAERIGQAPEALLERDAPHVWNQAAMELGALICTARQARCGACPAGPWCVSYGAVQTPARRSGTAVRFEDTNRFVRGRIVAALAQGGDLPTDIDAERVRIAVDGLVRDGVLLRDGGTLSLG